MSIVAKKAPDVHIINCESLIQDVPQQDFASVTVNQGTATKVKRVSTVSCHYPTDRPQSSLIWNIFHVQPRLRDSETSIKLTIMERHPYTTQTFVPMGSSSDRSQYMIAIAPDKQGRPDTTNVQCYLCHGAQAGMMHNHRSNPIVTYGANQWHAPMIGLHEVMTFAVMNAENGTTDDLDECEFEAVVVATRI